MYTILSALPAVTCCSRHRTIQSNRQCLALSAFGDDTSLVTAA